MTPPLVLGLAAPPIAATGARDPPPPPPRYRGSPFSLWRFMKSNQLLADAPMPGVFNRHNTFCLPPPPPPSATGDVGLLLVSAESCELLDGRGRELNHFHGSTLEGLHRNRLYVYTPMEMTAVARVKEIATVVMGHP